jgi:hypothetical protein
MTGNAAEGFPDVCSLRAYNQACYPFLEKAASGISVLDFRPDSVRPNRRPLVLQAALSRILTGMEK